MIKITVTLTHGRHWRLETSDGRSGFMMWKDKWNRKGLMLKYPGLKHALKEVGDTITFDDTERYCTPLKKSKKKRVVNRGLLSTGKRERR